MVKKSNLLIFLCLAVLLVLTVLGSFFDYEISRALYFGENFSENPIGIIFAFIGIIPSFVGWAFLGAGILPLIKRERMGKGKKRALIALSVLLFTLSFFYFCNTLMMVNDRAFTVPWWLAYPIGIAVIVFASYGGYKLSKISKNERLLKIIVNLALAGILLMVVIMSLKSIMDRPRYRLVFQLNDFSYFKNFWESGSDLKDVADIGAMNDEFSSFPSGHSAYAMFAVFLFPALADYTPKLEKYRTALFIFGFIWWAITAFSRVTVGAHYLTDVCIAGVICIFSYALIVAFRKIIFKERLD